MAVNDEDLSKQVLKMDSKHQNPNCSEEGRRRGDGGRGGGGRESSVPKSREEGEVSSSDDAEIFSQEDHAFCSKKFISSDAAQVEQVHVDAVNENSHSTRAEKYTSSSTLGCSIDAPSRAPQESNHLKNPEKNRGPFVPFVICFSDEDSGSDCDKAGHNTSSCKDGTRAVDKSKKPLAFAPRRPQKLEKFARNEGNVMPRKRPLSRTFVSSMPKISGGTKNVGPSQNLRIVDRGQRLNLHLDTGKVQDLRQLIAIRENQLKLNTFPKTKKLSSASSRDDNLVNAHVGRAFREITPDHVQSELNERNTKRQKIVSPHPSRGHSNPQENTHPVIAIERYTPRNSDQHKLTIHSNEVENIPFCSLVAGKLKKNEDHGPVSSTNLSLTAKEGMDAARNSHQICQNSKSVEPVISSRPAENRAAHRLGKVNTGPVGNGLTEKCNNDQVRSIEQAQKPVPDGNNIASSIQMIGINPEANATFVNLPSIGNCLDKLNIGGSNNMDLQSLLDLEELQDKKLEEAQEYRRKCEIEERNALKTYRKTQRALLEANARCSYLYNKREQYSAQLRCLMLGNPNLYLSCGTCEGTGTELNPLTAISDVNMHLIPTSNCAAQPAQDFNNQQRCNSNIHPDVGALPNVSSMQAEHQNLVSDPCVEPDGSTSEPHKDDSDGNGVCFPPEDFSMSPDEDEGVLQYEHKSPENSSEYQGKGKSNVHKENNETNGSGAQLSAEKSQDYLLLEASLRSKLVERLRMRTLSQTMGQSENVEPLAEGRVENDDFVERVEISMGNPAFSDTEKENEMQKDSYFQGCDTRGTKMPVAMDHHCNSEKLGSSFASPSANMCLDSCEGYNRSQFSRSSTFSYPILRSAFSNFMVANSMNLLKLQTRNPNVQASRCQDENNFGSETMPSISNLELVEAASVDYFGTKNGSYSCNFSIDPLWPLCIYELRGKCNNDECSWQHLRDYSSGSRMKDTVDNDDKVGSPTQGQKYSVTRTLTKSLDCLIVPPPTYLVGLDVLKADLQPFKSILTHKYGQHWFKCFSVSFVLSNQLPTDRPSKEPFVHSNDARIEVYGGWNGQSLYFRSRSQGSGLGKEPFADDDQSVELALLSLSQEANKLKGRMQALKVLVQALEANPTSAVLWIIYLLIYYSCQKSIGKDDMFRCAVENNEGSYELWLLYINSRTQLDERLAAYDAALSALCRHASASDINALCTSECILDIFLQMMDCLCMSGNVGKAIDKIYGLYPTTKKSDNPLKLFLPDIITCLTIHDKCIFWVCCVYLVVYRRLPDALVQRFEYQKELASIDWSSADLTIDEKQRGVCLMELAVDSLALYIDRESLEDEANLKAAHLFAVNHVRCVAVLEGLECSRNLLERYVKLYPSCLELVLMLARVEYDFACGSFEGYEEALDNWLDEIPGVQCIWNQYVQCALQDGKLDFVKELMARWFRSLCKLWSQSKTPESIDGNNSQCSLQSASVSDVFAFFSQYSQHDVVFGLLNFSIYKMLQNDHAEAQLAIDRALEAANAENYSHCVREKLLLLTAADLQEKGAILKVLCGYLADNRASVASEPLSRQFIQRIKKPRVQQLVGKLLCPVPLEPCLVNSVLEALYGPSLLPQMNDILTDFVDLVESLMEILPSNYYLAIFVCKQLIRTPNVANVSGSVSFWASSLLSNTLFLAIPVAPEYIWVEAAGILHDLTDSRTLCIAFLKRALAIYPFSMMLWKSYLKFSEAEGNAKFVKEAAREKGIRLE